ncbi:hypothetical protein VC83_07323 [Pseudogymnoascus destructans]|uniref:Uncharacterized protein n=1 Tax=Pseudogymnoascus destructans TaxID=655981 RepID=A0A177A661_9PEZI|nr:uncharacterized protein VC83_07323 [Pseudogymnoascus destructans]OAF56623.1 hypothetical protein VC83_07323 [Pseudogymnoascus destructans]
MAAVRLKLNYQSILYKHHESDFTIRPMSATEDAKDQFMGTSKHNEEDNDTNVDEELWSRW